MIFITGANGYVGVHLAERLRSEGKQVRALVRRGCRKEDKEFLSRMGAQVVEADLEDKGSLAEALRGVRTVVHLLGSIERPSRGGYRGMHTAKTGLLIDAFKAEIGASGTGGGAGNGGRIVYLSALGAAEDAANLYQKTKWEAEETIRRSGLDYVILRASLIFGRETGNRDSKLVRKLTRLAMTGKTVPVIGSGRNQLQPVYISDLVTCLGEAICAGGTVGEVWEIGGAEVVTLRELVETLLGVLGLKRRIAGIPYPAAYLLGTAARLAGAEGKINLEQVKMTRCNNTCARNRTPLIVGEGMTSLEEGLRKTVERFGAEAMAGMG